MMRSIEEANIEKGTIVIVRADWNVPMSKAHGNPEIDEGCGEVLDTTRIEATAKTINFILNKEAKVIVLSHLGDGSDSLEPVVKVAEKIFANTKIRFVRDPWNNSSVDGKQAIDHLQCGEIAVFENVRFWMEKENDDNFAQKLAAFGDIYVNEAFPVSHRKHTSLFALPKLLPHFAGFRFLEEYQRLSEAFNPEHPFLFILGGAKFDTKLPLVEKFLNTADNIFIGGANALPASNMPLASNAKVFFPIGELDAMDANSETLEMLGEKIKDAKFVLWNGPLGNYEKGFIAGTNALARILAESQAKVIIGGGDTLETVGQETEKEILKHGFISTAGGAMLDFLANGTLPGIEALN